MGIFGNRQSLSSDASHGPAMGVRGLGNPWKRRPASGLLMLVIVGGFMLEGAATAEKKRTPTKSPVSLVPYVGYWEGAGAVDLGRQRGRARVALSITEEVVLFEVTYGNTSTRARLKPLRPVDGGIDLAVDYAESQGMGVDLGPITLNLRGVSPGPLQIRLESAPPEPPSSKTRRNSSRKHTPPPPKPERILRFHSGTLSQAQVLSASERTYGSSDFLRYADWRTSTDESGELDVRREEADQRVAEDIQRLQEGGWKCLSQIHRNIPEKGTLDLTLEASPGTPRLHLIYSRLPGPRIVYSAAKQPAGYLHFYRAKDRNYPVIVSENGWTTRLTLTTQPAAGSLERLPRSIPVTVFIFGNTFGDYGDGCRLEEFGLESTRQFNEYVEVLGGIAIAVGLEAVRRQSVESDAQLVQALATIGRNAAIEAILRRLFPSASGEMIGYFGRWAGLLVAADVSALSLFRDTAREAIVQQIQRDRPELSGETKLVDLLVDLHLQRQALRERRTVH